MYKVSIKTPEERIAAWHKIFGYIQQGIFQKGQQIAQILSSTKPTPAEETFNKTIEKLYLYCRSDIEDIINGSSKSETEEVKFFYSRTKNTICECFNIKIEDLEKLQNLKPSELKRLIHFKLHVKWLVSGINLKNAKQRFADFIKGRHVSNLTDNAAFVAKQIFGKIELTEENQEFFAALLKEEYSYQLSKKNEELINVNLLSMFCAIDGTAINTFVAEKIEGKASQHFLPVLLAHQPREENSKKAWNEAIATRLNKTTTKNILELLTRPPLTKNPCLDNETWWNAVLEKWNSVSHKMTTTFGSKLAAPLIAAIISMRNTIKDWHTTFVQSIKEFTRAEDLKQLIEALVVNNVIGLKIEKNEIVEFGDDPTISNAIVERIKQEKNPAFLKELLHPSLCQNSPQIQEAVIQRIQSLDEQDPAILKLLIASPIENIDNAIKNRIIEELTTSVTAEKNILMLLNIKNNIISNAIKQFINDPNATLEQLTLLCSESIVEDQEIQNAIKERIKTLQEKNPQILELLIALPIENINGAVQERIITALKAPNTAEKEIQTLLNIENESAKKNILQAIEGIIKRNQYSELHALLTPEVLKNEDVKKLALNQYQAIQNDEEDSEQRRLLVRLLHKPEIEKSSKVLFMFVENNQLQKASNNLLQSDDHHLRNINGEALSILLENEKKDSIIAIINDYIDAALNDVEQDVVKKIRRLFTINNKAVLDIVRNIILEKINSPNQQDITTLRYLIQLDVPNTDKAIQQRIESVLNEKNNRNVTSAFKNAILFDTFSSEFSLIPAVFKNILNSLNLQSEILEDTPARRFFQRLAEEKKFENYIKLSLKERISESTSKLSLVNDLYIVAPKLIFAVISELIQESLLNNIDLLAYKIIKNDKKIEDIKEGLNNTCSDKNNRDYIVDSFPKLIKKLCKLTKSSIELIQLACAQIIQDENAWNNLTASEQTRFMSIFKNCNENSADPIYKDVQTKVINKIDGILAVSNEEKTAKEKTIRDMYLALALYRCEPQHNNHKTILQNSLQQAIKNNIATILPSSFKRAMYSIYEKIRSIFTKTKYALTERVKETTTKTEEANKAIKDLPSAVEPELQVKNEVPQKMYNKLDNEPNGNHNNDYDPFGISNNF